jgi:hypothetical protein
MRHVRVLFAGPGARRALTAGHDGAVELVSGRRAYLRLGTSGWVLLTEPGAPFGPLSLAVDGLEQLELRPGASAGVVAGRLVLGSQVVSFERTRSRGAPAIRVAAEPPAIAAAAAAAQALLPPSPPRIRPGLLALFAGRVAGAVRLLAGVGEGLTPAGEDVLAGYAAARVAIAAPVALSAAAAGRSTGLGLAYLRCAERGELADAAARLLAAICRGSAADAVAALPPLQAWGSSSGMALAWGINAGVRNPSRRPRADNRDELSVAGGT